MRLRGFKLGMTHDLEPALGEWLREEVAVGLVHTLDSRALRR
jgi:hypothetical protein